MKLSCVMPTSAIHIKKGVYGGTLDQFSNEKALLQKKEVKTKSIRAKTGVLLLQVNNVSLNNDFPLNPINRAQVRLYIYIYIPSTRM